VKYAIIGTGYWGSNHVRVGAELVQEGTLESLVVCDVDESRAADLASDYGVEYTTDYAELPDLGVDAATVATPSTTHRQIAVELLNEGLDLLVEKPLALTAEDAWAIVDAADNNDATLGVGHIFRYHPALNELKERIDRGELGQIKYLNTNRFSFRVPRATTGVLYSLAVHDVDVYTYLLDDAPNAIYCNLDSVIRKDIDETATLVLDYDRATGVINESWQVPVFGKRRDLSVVGSQRSAYIDYLDDTELEVFDAYVTKMDGDYRAHSEGKQHYETERREPLRVEVTEFVEAANAGDQPRASGKVGARTVEILEHAQRSNARNEAVFLD
jgi:predicted dehydrogenase